tara:strand:- start:901 stop:1356 length:456 start_codon:yes stop_codon:yes gene_type:complete
MKVAKFGFIVLVVSILSACSSLGPMQTMQGPLNTPVFEPVAIDTVKDGSSSVLFKEWTTMYENQELKLWGVFFITQNGVYMANWDSRSYEYNLRYRIDSSDISSISEETVERSMWIDSDLLVITDQNGHEVGFALNGKNAARSFLQNIGGE